MTACFMMSSCSVPADGQKNLFFSIWNACKIENPFLLNSWEITQCPIFYDTAPRFPCQGKSRGKKQAARGVCWAALLFAMGFLWVSSGGVGFGCRCPGRRCGGGLAGASGSGSSSPRPLRVWRKGLPVGFLLPGAAGLAAAPAPAAAAAGGGGALLLLHDLLCQGGQAVGSVCPWRGWLRLLRWWRERRCCCFSFSFSTSASRARSACSAFLPRSPGGGGGGAVVGMGGSLLVLRHELVQGGGQGGLLPAVLVLGGLADLPQLGQLLLGGST